MIRKIKNAEYSNLENTEVIITFEDETTAVHIIDETMRENTSSWLTFLEEGGVVGDSEQKMNLSRMNKKDEIMKGFKIYKTQNIIVNDKPFYASDKALTQYTQLYNLGLSMGLEEGEALTPHGWVNVTKEEMEEAIQKIAYQLVIANKKLSHYIIAIQTASTQEDLNLIVWEDEYSGGA